MSRESDPLEVADDSILVGRAADGDTAAFAVIVRRYAPMLRAYARRILSGSADVDDVVQDALITAWRQLPRMGEPAKVKSWLMRITSRKAIDRLRSTRPQVDLDDVDAPASDATAPARQAEARAGVAALSDALQALPVAQRECWVLREIGGYTYEEIADQLGVPLSTVRGLLARARKDVLVRMENWR